MHGLFLLRTQKAWGWQQFRDLSLGAEEAIRMVDSSCFRLSYAPRGREFLRNLRLFQLLTQGPFRIRFIRLVDGEGGERYNISFYSTKIAAVQD